MMICFYVWRLRSVLSFDTLKIGYYYIVFLGDMGFAMKNFQVLTMAWLSMSIGLMAAEARYEIRFGNDAVFSYAMERDFQVNSPQLQRVVADAILAMHVTIEDNQPDVYFRLVYPNAAQEYTSLKQEKREKLYFDIQRLLFFLLPQGAEKAALAEKLNLAYNPEDWGGVRQSLFGSFEGNCDDIMFYNFVMSAFIPEDAEEGPGNFITGLLVVQAEDGASKNVLQARIDAVTERWKYVFKFGEFDSFITD